MNTAPATAPIIAPSILAADWGRLNDEVAAVTRAGADWLHLDVMDGRFVPPITFGADFVRAVKHVSAIPLDVHLMIEAPERQIQAFADAGASMLTVHQEACPHLHRVVQTIRQAGMKAGVALNPGTAYHLLEPILPEIDLVLIMTVNPGWGGQKFIPTMLEKIRALRLMIAQTGRQIHLEVDGGIDPATAKRAAAAGADVLVAGSAVFHHGQRNENAYREAIAAIRSAACGSPAAAASGPGTLV